MEDGVLLRQESSSQLLRESHFAFVCVTQQILHVPLSIHISSINLSKNLLHAVGLKKEEGRRRRRKVAGGPRQDFEACTCRQDLKRQHIILFSLHLALLY